MEPSAAPSPTDVSSGLQPWDIATGNQGPAHGIGQTTPASNHQGNVGEHPLRAPSIDVLPNEVLMAIFKLASDMAWPFHSGPIGDDVVRRAELNIASTCSKWRTIAIAQSELWRTIWIPFTMEVLDNNHTTEALEIYLQRSHSQSLDLWLTLAAEVPDDSILSVLDTLVAHSDRVRRLGILFDDGAPKSLVVRQILMGWNLERMESLELYVDSEDEDNEPLVDDNMPGNLSQLKHLRSSAAFFDVQRPYLSQLTTLYLESTNAYVPHSASNLFAEIIGLPNLITLSVAEGTFAIQTAAQPTSPFVALKLKHFRCGDTALAKLVLVNAYFPELEILALHHIFLKTMVFPTYSNRADTPPPTLAPKLQTLALVDCRSNTRSSKFLASATSSANHLVIDTVDEPYQSNVMEFIWLDPTTKTQFWPNLQTFTYMTKRSFAETILPASYRAFSKSRSTDDKQLKIVAHHVGPPLFKRRSENFVRCAEQWNEMLAAGVVENFHSNRGVVPWPIDNLFISNAEYSFTR